MNREESLALYAKGRDAWNAWAKKMLDECTALKAAGTWEEGRIENAGFLQTPLSAALIFLFLLAVRNHFRIK